MQLGWEALPSASLTTISQCAQPAERWFDVEMLQQGVHSLNPIQMWRLMHVAPKQELSSHLPVCSLSMRNLPLDGIGLNLLLLSYWDTPGGIASHV